MRKLDVVVSVASGSMGSLVRIVMGERNEF